jgi:hypothetical protein
VSDTHVSRIGCYRVVWRVRGLLFLDCLLPDKVLLETCLTLRTGTISTPLSIIQRHSLLQILILKYSLKRVIINDAVARAAMLRILLHELLVDDSALLRTEIIISHNPPDNIVFIERPHPSLRDFVFNLVFNLDLIWTLGECRLH